MVKDALEAGGRYSILPSCRRHYLCRPAPGCCCLIQLYEIFQVDRCCRGDSCHRNLLQALGVCAFGPPYHSRYVCQCTAQFWQTRAYEYHLFSGRRHIIPVAGYMGKTHQYFFLWIQYSLGHPQLSSAEPLLQRRMP